MKDELEIKSLSTLDELQEMQRLELEIWGMEPIPAHQTLTVSKNGGIILGGYERGQLIGFVYSFPGFNGKSIYLCSHMLGIHPDYQGKGYGKLLKLAQKEAALSKGYQLMTWTFDPLESVNANLNISKLQAICRTYIEDCYGKMKDTLNAGLATDRFMVEWWLNHDHLNRRYTKEEAVTIVTVHEDEHGFPVMDAYETEEIIAGIKQLLPTQPILVPIPTNFQKIKTEAHSLAINWRMKTRQLFNVLFLQGYVIADIKRDADSSVQHYVLLQASELNIHD